RAHERDERDRIIWGSVYIGDVVSGKIIEQWTHGQRIAKEWIDPHVRGAIWPYWEHNIASHIPPLWAEVGQGWQYGIIQPINSFAITLRDPMINLAQNGILELRHGGRNAPQIRRLMLRFLDPVAARNWAISYSEAMSKALDDSAIVLDRTLLEEQIQQRRSE